MKARIALALGASVALHVAVLGCIAWSGLDSATGQSASASRPGLMVKGRLLRVDEAVLPATEASSSGKAAPPAAGAVPDGLAVAGPGLATGPARPMTPPASMPAAPAAPATGAGPLAGFVPASQLTVKPVPVFVGELEPDWLSEIKGAAVAMVSVYVAADGSVFHVEVRQSSNPRIAGLVHAAFAQARFKPGAVHGQNVAARVDISLDYESMRDRVRQADSARAPDAVLGAQDARQASLLAPDERQQKLDKLHK